MGAALAHLHVVAGPLVTKEYFEDLGTKDSDGYDDYAYRPELESP